MTRGAPMIDGADETAARVLRLELDLKSLALDAAILRRTLDEGGAAAATALAQAEARTEAVRIVLMALVGAIRPGAIDRRRFQEAVRAAAATTPDSGPQAVRHGVFLAETRRVLGIAD